MQSESYQYNAERLSSLNVDACRDRSTACCTMRKGRLIALHAESRTTTSPPPNGALFVQGLTLIDCQA